MEAPQSVMTKSNFRILKACGFVMTILSLANLAHLIKKRQRSFSFTGVGIGQTRHWYSALPPGSVNASLVLRHLATLQERQGQEQSTGISHPQYFAATQSSQILRQGEQLWSSQEGHLQAAAHPNGPAFRAAVQTDGNFVLYRFQNLGAIHAKNHSKQAVWSSKTSQRGGGNPLARYSLTLSDNGALQLREHAQNRGEKLLWSTPPAVRTAPEVCLRCPAVSQTTCFCCHLLSVMKQSEMVHICFLLCFCVCFKICRSSL